FIESLNTNSKCLLAGLSETYAKCHRLYLELHNQQDAELLHEWRKRIKDLQHQHEMVSALLPSDLFAASENIDLLTERLGRDQDLNNLRLWMNQDGVSQNHSVMEIERITDHIEEMRKQLQAEIDQIAGEIFSVSPEIFQKKLGEIS
ncbi:MAG: CHAD domain-containing protein, partial [Balneolaceae bacterium]|nr:CHAD domain-containing protein [Balneolaceae bacterium]